MKKFLVAFFISILMLDFGGVVYANTIIDLIGDKDGFGIGATADNGFDFNTIGSGDGDGTDVWRFSDFSYTHTYDISGLANITSAELEIFAGGTGLDGATSIYLDGTLLGTLTIGDGSYLGTTNYARLDTFDLTPYLSLINGSETILINTILEGDGWVLDYSQISVVGDPVPEPATMFLLGTGLVGVAGAARRRKKNQA